MHKAAKVACIHISHCTVYWQKFENFVLQVAKRTAVEISDSKKLPCRVQTTVFKYFQLSSSQQSSPGPSPTPCAKASVDSVAMAPQAYGIHCFTEDEIRSAKDLQKTFRKFWNAKANELCASKEVRSKLQRKNAIQCAIYASWALENTSHLQLLAEGLEEDMKMKWKGSIYTHASIWTGTWRECCVICIC